MNDAIELKGVSYRYPERDEYALEDLNLTVGRGEFILLCGKSGSGKSTLCRLLNGLVPHYFGGRMEGKVKVDGLDTSFTTVSEMSAHVGFVFQDPESQIVMSRVENEIAFGLENLRLSQDDIKKRLTESATSLGVAHLLDRKTDELSGGEKQRVLLACILAMKPKILVLDEPTSQLDLPSRLNLYEILKRLNKQGMTIILVEHNIKEAKRHVSRIITMPQKTTAKQKIPPLKGDLLAPKPSRQSILQVEHLSGGYGKNRVIENVSLSLLGGQCLAVTGQNGSGKTTLIRHFMGLMKPQAGSVLVCGQDTRHVPPEKIAHCAAYLPQNPSDMLFCETVEEEVMFSLRHLGIEGDVDAILDQFNLYEHRRQYPRDLSVGEKQRLALAAVLVSRPKLLILDEPTRGIDDEARNTLVCTIRRMLKNACSAVIVTQDDELVAEVSSCRIHLGVDK
jgi:energy-coupling factor transport system ATP-binding protein